MNRPERLSAAADRYYAEGCAEVESADRSWATAHDPNVPTDFRAAAMHTYRITAARARSRFHRHDVALDAAARRQKEATDG